MDRAGSENFPVASRLLPRRQRQHLLAVYGYARLVDEIGDATPGGPHQRDRAGGPGRGGPDGWGGRDGRGAAAGALLDLVQGEIDRIYDGGGQPEHPVMRALATTVRACRIPRAPLEALIAANRQDQSIHAYPTFAALESYCELSANPVGHLVLHVFEAATPERLRLSNRICTALQLAEHWQDVVEDFRRGRVYVPTEDLERFGCSRGDLVTSPAPEPVRLLLRFEVERARRVLAEGAPLVGLLRGRARWAVAAFVAGGGAALTAIQRHGYDVSAGAPRASRPARLAGTIRAGLGWR